MIQILKHTPWSKADGFMLPLTGLKRDELGKDRKEKFPVNSYLFWEDYSIEDYKLILTIKWSNYEEFVQYCRNAIFPILDKKGYLVESYDCEEGFSIFILDISEWALDIEMFLKGKYSKLSLEARNLIENFHQHYVKGSARIPNEIHAALYPTQKRTELGNMTYIEYIAKNYDFDIDEMNRIGELAGIYEINANEDGVGGETLTAKCNFVMT